MKRIASVHQGNSLYRRARLVQHRRMRRLLVTEADYANLSMLESRPVRRWLARATRVQSDAMPADVVTMNSRIVCTDSVSGERRVLSVVYPADADAAEGRLSVLTPAGLALLGASAGQAVEWAQADGTPQRMRLEALVYQPEQDLRAGLIFPSHPRGE